VCIHTDYNEQIRLCLALEQEYNVWGGTKGARNQTGVKGHLPGGGGKEDEGRIWNDMERRAEYSAETTSARKFTET
jgi:hypothetical protein